MLEFLRSLFFPPQRSSETAKQRLRVVLLSDHLSLAPETVDALKRDLLEVISRYVEIDPAHADVSFEQREREVAMLANIPITGVRDWPKPQAPALEPKSSVELEPVASPVQAEAPSEPEDEPSVLPDSTVPEPSRPQMPARASFAATPRRRKRRKKPGEKAAVAPRPLPSHG